MRARHAPIHDPLLQSPEFPCMSSTCEGLNVKFDVNKSRKQEDKILDLLSDTDYSVTLQGDGYTDVEEMLKLKGIDKKTDMWKLPGAKLQKWNLYTEDKLKKMTAKGASYNEIKAVRYLCLLPYHICLIVALTVSHRHLRPSLVSATPTTRSSPKLPHSVFTGLCSLRTWKSQAS